MSFLTIPKELYKERRLIMSLAKNDIKNRFAGSYLGVFWAFIQPIITVLVYWIVFEVGFKSPGTVGFPFVLFLVTGIVPWFFFSDGLNGGMNSFVEYSYLVKKVVFHIDILPMVKILSALFVHVFFVAFAMVLATLYGYPPTAATLQIFYYMFCNIFLVIGLSYLCATVTIFFRDLSQFINIIVLQLGMWMTPVLWSASDMLGNRPKLMKVFKLNPMFYIVDGFRDSLLFREFHIFDKPAWGLYFWAFSLTVFVLGTGLYRKLKPHFADIL